MITGKQRSYLRTLANGMQPIFQVGKNGVTENVIKQFDDALEARELVKASMLKNSLEEVRDVCQYIADETNAEIVQIVGSKFVLYRESEKNKQINLP